MEQIWLERRSEAYKDAVDRRRYAWDHFTGDAKRKTIKNAYKHAEVAKKRILQSANGLVLQMFEGGTAYSDEKYLIQSTQGEPDDAYYERARITEFFNHTATLVEANVGGIFAVESKKDIFWEGGALGDPEEEGSVYYRLLRNIDGKGTDMSSRTLVDAARMLVNNVTTSLYVRPNEDDPLTIQYVHPDKIVQERFEDGVRVEALVEELEVTQESLKDVPESRTVYTRYTIDGWEKYVLEDKNGQMMDRMIGSGAWAFPLFTDDTKTVRRLPLSVHELGLERHVGHEIAEGHNGLYNLYSDGRWLLRVANRPRLAGDVDNALFDKTMERSRSGYNALQGPWDFIAPDAANANSVFARYNDGVIEYYTTNHQRMNQAAIERSAAEILQQEGGRTAFLSMFKRSWDEMDNDRLFMASQMEAPEFPEMWHKCYVERSDDFKPIDIEHIASTRAISFAAISNTLPAVTAARMAGYEEDIIDEIRLSDSSVPEDELGIEEEEDDGSAEESTDE